MSYLLQHNKLLQNQHLEIAHIYSVSDSYRLTQRDLFLEGSPHGYSQYVCQEQDPFRFSQGKVPFLQNMVVSRIQFLKIVDLQVVLNSLPHGPLHHVCLLHQNQKGREFIGRLDSSQSLFSVWKAVSVYVLFIRSKAVGQPTFRGKEVDEGSGDFWRSF